MPMTMHHDQRLLGFDAREMWVDSSHLWPQSRRQTYLLRPDAAKPLSTDTAVWPSVFDEDDTLRRPSWIGPVQDLWEDRSTLQDHLGRAWGTSWKPCWLLAVTLVYDLCTKEEQADWDWRTDRIQPSTLGPNGSFLGYDVSDQWLLSGLMNCGYMPEHEDVEGLRRRWAPHLNQHHLFDDLEQAAAFKAVSDERVSEHAPFFVFGLYRLPHGDSPAA